ncbi:MAG: hypothetical protein ACI90V_011344, partial [Bacillariaceae sp.]
KAIETETARYTDQIKHLQNNGKSHYTVENIHNMVYVYNIDNSIRKNYRYDWSHK